MEYEEGEKQNPCIMLASIDVPDIEYLPFQLIYLYTAFIHQNW